MSNSSFFINSTRIWLETIIIGYAICPFAKPELESGGIRFYVDEAVDLESCLHNLVTECARLDLDDGIATTLLIYSQGFAEFDDYLDFLGLAEALLVAQGYEGVYQLASFHPDYCFDQATPDDAANYTNRSPYPMLHLLRESSIEAAVANHPDAKGIPRRNIKLTRQLGLSQMQAMLAACYQNNA
ncbi:MAG: DUF1415 domain-containing protein [Methylovulum sp.]|uniref:DUF1415 domain-containing protein n=1 Tax=Methylovulum sp. TaxID=1916980 RepID=UPI002610E53F|nr:DUF1415 domain-containing protein [Methylovulum sp.]MDD2722598.1 DUF1415 domain-containing protein [Methylovulum sp.]MDD5123804.1 DUF1415 domain-containing protein [Methylovulum sp.]